MKRYLLLLVIAIFCLPDNSFAQNYGTPGYYGERIRSGESALASIWSAGKYGGTDGFNWNSKQKKPRKTTTPITKESLVAEMTKDAETGLTTIRWNNGAVYVGEIYYAELNGKGTMTYADGSKYIGNWSKDRRWGVGSMYYSNGDVYHGEWMWDLPFGQGTFITAEGVAFTGKFKDGEPHGKCIIQDTDGQLYKARWYYGKLRKRSIKPLEEKNTK